MVNKAFSDHDSYLHQVCARTPSTGVEILKATVTNTGPAVMSNRTALFTLTAATLMTIGTAAPANAREVVRYNAEVQPGTIVVKTAERKLYLVLGDGQAIRYTVAVGRPGKQWQGKAQVNGKYVQPAWTPPAEVKADNPALPDVIPGGAPNNPMGVAAMTLSGGEYAIHGTNKPESIGKFASYGCIRMLNQDITDLFGRVNVGTQVVVLR
jgi:lipoprotein-anchoring transpeptidase ErfK/SrfK